MGNYPSNSSPSVRASPPSSPSRAVFSSPPTASAQQPTPPSTPPSLSNRDEALSHYDADVEVKTLPLPAPSEDPILATLRALPLTVPLIATLDPPLSHAPSSAAYAPLPIDRIDGRSVTALLDVVRAHFAADVVDLLGEQRRLAKALDDVDADYAAAVAEVGEKKEEMAALLGEVSQRQSHLTQALVGGVAPEG